MKKTILLVEDCHATRDSLKLALEQEGYVVVDTSNVLEALVWLSQAKNMPDLCVTDYNCLGDGSHLAKTLSRANVPVMMITGTPREAHNALSAKGLIHTRVMAKPLDLDSFLNFVSGYVEDCTVSA